MKKTSLFAESLLNPGEFTYTYELVPGQGAGGRRIDTLLEFARNARQDGRIKALSITDNPGGVAALAPVAMGTEILQMGIEPLIHFSLKDKNRNQIESHIFLYQRFQLKSLLVLGGDFPKQGHHGQARPVYDLDSIQTLQLMQDMSTGCYRTATKPSRHTVVPDLFKGCVVSPFKTTEAEQVWQYAKLLHKISAGANFIITQLGFDFLKFKELIYFSRQHNLQQPILANVFIPSLPVARIMAVGNVPGVSLSPSLIKAMEDETKQGNTKARLDRAIAMIIALKKIGYQGVHIGGNGLCFSDLQYIMDRVATGETSQNHTAVRYDFPVENSWYLYKQTDGSTDKMQQSPLHPGRKRIPAQIHQLTHDLLFADQSPLARYFGRFCLYCAKNKYRYALLRTIEKIIKQILFSCRMCGDCTLERAAYLCPQSGCPKRLVNGPCGGSLKGYCEVFPDRACFWVLVYDRLSPDITIRSLADRPALPPKNWALEKTSSWINYFSAKKHSSDDQ